MGLNYFGNHKPDLKTGKAWPDHDMTTNDYDDLAESQIFGKGSSWAFAYLSIRVFMYKDHNPTRKVFLNMLIVIFTIIAFLPMIISPWLLYFTLPFWIVFMLIIYGVKRSIHKSTEAKDLK